MCYHAAHPARSPMPLVATERSPVSRKRALGVFLRQGVVGLLLLAWLTATRPAEPARIVVFAVVFVVSNNVIVSRVELALGYSLKTSAYLGLIDSGIYMVTLPYAILTTFSYGGIGWGGVLAAAVTGVIVNVMGRKLALTRTDKERLAQRLASLSSIGKTVSLRYSTDELLPVVYAECGKVIDVTMFTIALFDDETNELCSVLRADHATILPSFRVPLGEGLNSWVVENRRPLRLGSVDE